MISRSGQSVDYSAPGGSEVDNIAALTKMPGYQVPQLGNATDSAVANAPATPMRTPNLLMVLIGVIVFLVVLKFVTEHDKAKMQLSHVRISVFNWVFITLMAVTGIVAWKAIQNKYWPQAALTRFVNAS